MGRGRRRRLVAHLDNVGAEPIANAPDRRDVPGGVWIVLQLASQAVHDDPQGVAAVRCAPAPDLADDRLHRQRFVRPCHQEGQHGVLGRGERQRPSIERDLPGEKIDGESVGS